MYNDGVFGLLHQDGHTFRMKFTDHHKSFEPVSLPVENPLGQSCYDAIWILALALEKTIDGTLITMCLRVFV